MKEGLVLHFATPVLFLYSSLMQLVIPKAVNEPSGWTPPPG